jgi:hypothetical protein
MMPYGAYRCCPTALSDAAYSADRCCLTALTDASQRHSQMLPYDLPSHSKMLNYLHNLVLRCTDLYIQYSLSFLVILMQVCMCAAEAFCYCPAIISHRPRSQNILKERALNPKKDSRIKRPRSQVSLEKSSQNYKPLKK